MRSNMVSPLCNSSLSSTTQNNLEQLHHSTAQVLSAAHCERAATQNFVTLGLHKLILDAGDGDFDTEFLNLEHIPIETSEVHPNYNPTTHENDFWMIKLKWASQLYANELVVLDTPTDGFEPTSGDNLIAMGFGDIQTGGPSSNVLKENNLDYITNAECTSAPNSWLPGDITDSMLCAGTVPGQSTCQVLI